jgi:YVTN family beta-propeller protein
MRRASASAVGALILSGCSGCGRSTASAPVSTSPNLPLTLVADVDLPGNATRFDYQEIDPAQSHLVVAHMNDASVLVLSLADGSVVKLLPNIPTPRGVTSGDGRIFVTSSPSQLVLIDATSLAEIARVPTGNGPDGVGYDPVDKIVGVSDQRDGAMTGNYALVYKDAGGALFDEGIVYFRHTANLFTFSAVGFTTPTFWDDAAFYIIAVGQHATDIRVWDYVPTAAHPPSTGDLADTSVFVKFAKPLSKTFSFGVMGAYELSQATLLPDSGAPPINFHTSYLPSGGAGLHWHPDDHWQAGLRVILNHDNETRTQGGVSKSGLLRSYEYRLGAAYSPWAGTLFDIGAAALDRSNGLEGTSTFDVHPTVGAEQMLVKKMVWVRGGLDETTWTTGASLALKPFKFDVAYLFNLASARTQDVFGKTNTSLIVTVNFDYESMLAKKK